MKTTMKNGLILFDLDGTLLDTLDDLGAAVNHALSRRGFPLHSRDAYRKMVGHGVRNLVRQALPADRQPAENGGIRAVAVSWGYRPMKDIPGLRVADNAEELEKTLAAILSEYPR